MDEKLSIAEHVERRPVGELRASSKNPRKHAPWQIQQIADSIRNFGFNNPLLIDSHGTVIAGHGRLAAALKLEMTEVPCVVLDHLTPEQARAYLIADNKIALNSEWDNDLLSGELLDLSALGYNGDVLGFNDAEIGRLLPDDAAPDSVDENWTGMPEHTRGSEYPFRSLQVHFNSDEDVADFMAKIGQDFSKKAKAIWHPRREKERPSDYEYATD